MADPKPQMDPDGYMIVELANGHTVSVLLAKVIGDGFDAADSGQLFSADDLAVAVAKHDLRKGA